MIDLDKLEALADAEQIMKRAIADYRPTHIASMISGGKDSAASHAVATSLGVKIDFIIHGNTRCGIPETSEFVRNYYGNLGPDFIEADAGTAYEDYVLRKGFFGKGVAAHGFAYRILKATPFRKAVSKNIRKRKRDVRVLLVNGARKDESANRRKNLEVYRRDPAAPGNVWVNIIHNWTANTREEFLEREKVNINPVAKVLCRSGECMCGTMQSGAERDEAALFYPDWGEWLTELEKEARIQHGFGWGESYPKKHDQRQIELFQPMCADCDRNAT